MNEIKIDIKNINTEKKLLNFIFKILKKNSSSNILIYLNKYNNENIFFIKNKLIKIFEKFDKYIKQVKIINFPICVIKDEKIRKKYFYVEFFEYVEEVVIKKNKKCYLCKMYFSCTFLYSDRLKINNNLFYSKNILSINNFIYKVTKICNFLEFLWIKKDDIYLELPFYHDNKIYLSDFFLKRIRLNIIYRESYKDLFLFDFNLASISNIDLIPNLFFKNYINQKKIDMYLKKFWISMPISFYLWKITKGNFKKINWFFLSYRSMDIDKYFINNNSILYNPISVKKWEIFHWDLNDKTFTKELDLIFINIKNIELIEKDFDKYIIWLNYTEVNRYIPYIYKFKYFLSFNNNDKLLLHYQIIARECWMKYIYNLPKEILFSLKNNQILDVNFKNWKIKVLW